MPHLKLFGLPLLLFLVPTGVRADAWADLVAADRAFAAEAREAGVRAAYLKVLAPEAVVFSPGPLPARAIWEEKPPDANRLEWAPAIAEVSLAGDLGYTYGPWRHTPAGEEKAQAFGHYLAVWQVDDKGLWRLLIDHSVDHGELPLPEAVRRQGGMSLGAPDPGPLYPPGLSDLREADLLAPGALNPVSQASDAVALRNDMRPATQLQAPALRAGPTARVETGALVSRSGDLAVTWGGSSDGPSWLRIWRRPLSSDPPGLGWRLAVDLARPVPVKEEP